MNICTLRYVPILSYGNLFKSYCRPVQATTIRLPINQHCNIYLNISVISISESPACTDPNDGPTKCMAISAHILQEAYNYISLPTRRLES